MPSLQVPRQVCESKRTRHTVRCCIGEPNTASVVRLQSERFRTYLANAGGSSTGHSFKATTNNVAAPTTSSPFRSLTATQEMTANRVYGDSLDYSTIFISDTAGLGGRPFTLAVEVSGIYIQILNCGTFWPGEKTLIHELAHAWQSQHHPARTKFMVNAVSCQAEAAKTNVAAAMIDPALLVETDFPLFYPYDAYAYHPSQYFVTMAAEQMASAIENEEPAIVAHIKSVAKNAMDPLCLLALNQVNFADHRIAGVKG